MNKGNTALLVVTTWAVVDSKTKDVIDGPFDLTNEELVALSFKHYLNGDSVCMIVPVDK